MSRRTERVGDLLLETISELLLREVKDPRVGAVTLTGVDVAPDLRHARIRYCTLGDQQHRESIQRGLESAAGFLQGKAARLLRMKRTPELRFEYDEGFEKADRIERLLREVAEPDGSTPDDDTSRGDPPGDDPPDDGEPDDAPDED